jgi:RNA polymerase sigma-32 factor
MKDKDEKKQKVENEIEEFVHSEYPVIEFDEANFDVELSGSGKELVRYDPLQSYLAEINRIPILSREEEHSLAVRYKEQGDTVAGYKLVIANLRLVVMLAREYQRNIQNILDLVQEGNIGLLEAVKQYDPYRGIRFPSYAVYWIRAYMLRFLINNIRLVKVGTTQAQRKLFFNLKKEKARLEKEGFIPEAKLLAQRLNVKESEVIEMEQRLGLPELSVDAPVRGVDNEIQDFHGILPDDKDTPEDIIEREEFAHSIREAVREFKQTVGDKERAIIEERLFSEDPATLQMIADKFNLSRERIRQLESRVKQQLKEYISQKLQLSDIGEVLIDSDEK